MFKLVTAIPEWFSDDTIQDGNDVNELEMNFIGIVEKNIR